MTARFTPTAEQQSALAAFTTGGSLVIEAGAGSGSGKTSTLQLLAASRPGKRGLYLAYNKAIQTDAAKRFPRNVTCRTAHSLAYATHGARMRHRLNAPRVPATRVASILSQREPIALGDGLTLTAASIASLAMRAVERFCRSPETSITARHFMPPEGATGTPGLPTLRKRVVYLAQQAWADLNDPHGQLKFTHDHYLKQWALSGPRLAYDYILFDEAQDADPCIAGVVTAQMRSAQVVMVGDAAQAIYGWRGAIDVLSTTSVDHRTRLSRSFRFGQAVADEANVWLARIGTSLRITGDPARASALDVVDNPDAVLCRTNGRAVQEIMTAHAGGIAVSLVGGGHDIRSLAQAAQRLQAGQPAGHPELIAFPTWQAVRDYAEHDPTRVRPRRRRETHRHLRRHRRDRRRGRMRRRRPRPAHRLHRAQSQRPGMGQGADRHRLPRTQDRQHRGTRPDPKGGGDARLRSRHPRQASPRQRRPRLDTRRGVRRRRAGITADARGTAPGPRPGVGLRFAGCRHPTLSVSAMPPETCLDLDLGRTQPGQLPRARPRSLGTQRSALQ
jgi:hypothetical protein